VNSEQPERIIGGDYTAKHLGGGFDAQSGQSEIDVAFDGTRPKAVIQLLAQLSLGPRAEHDHGVGKRQHVHREEILHELWRVICDETNATN
jgi:hypothetical protein